MEFIIARLKVAPDATFTAKIQADLATVEIRRDAGAAAAET